MTESSLNRPGRCPIRATPPTSNEAASVPELVQLASRPLNRRTVLRVGGVGAMAATIGTVGAAAWTPLRAKAATTRSMSPMAQAASGPLPDIQFDIGAFVHPAQTIAGVLVDFGVLYTFLAPASLTRNPTKHDQAVLAAALNTIEQAYAFSPSGIFTFVAYGLPYFNRLPSSLVASAMPRLTSEQQPVRAGRGRPRPDRRLAAQPGRDQAARTTSRCRSSRTTCCSPCAATRW